MAYLGYLDQARSRMDEALSESCRLGHAYTRANVLCFANWMAGATCSPMVHYDEFLGLSTQHGFRIFSGWALAFRGRSLIGLGQVQEGLAQLRQGLAELRSTETLANMPTLLSWLSEAHALLGQPAEEQTCVAEAARIVEITDERIDEAEFLHRVRGDLLKSAGERSAAEQCYRQAIAVAERQGARLYQLRASNSLALLWRDQGRHAQARDLLRPIYNWFTEGFDSLDLKVAKALLDEPA